MRKSHALWGVLLIFIGAIWILGTTNTVSIDLWGALSTLWPILIIAAGITLFLKKEAHWMRVILWILVFAIIGGYGFYLAYSDTGTTGSNNTFEFVDGMNRSRLQVDTMSATLDIGSTDTVLAKVDSNIKDLKYNYSGGKSTNIRYYQRFQTIGLSGGNRNFSASLNSTIPWDLEFNTGSTDGTIDFSNVIVNNCNVNSASCDLHIIAGDLQDDARITINTASANIDITIPSDSGIRIQTSALSNNVRGNGVTMDKNGNRYESSNFNSAKKVVIVEINSASSNVSVNVR